VHSVVIRDNNNNNNNNNNHDKWLDSFNKPLATVYPPPLKRALIMIQLTRAKFFNADDHFSTKLRIHALKPPLSFQLRLLAPTLLFYDKFGVLRV